MDAIGTGVTQSSGSFAVDNSGVVNALTIAFTDSSNDTVKLVQNGSTIAISGTVAGSSIAGTATNMTSVSVMGGTGNNLLDASQMVMPVTLNGGAGSGPDTLLGGSGSDTFYYSGAGSTYDGGGGAVNNIIYPAKSGDIISVAVPELVVNDVSRNLGGVSRIGGFLVSGSPASVNNSQQLFWPLDDVPLTNAAITSLTVVPLTGIVVLSAGFTDANPQASAATEGATIAWGDGTTSTGTVASSGGGIFTISASHVYAANATHPIVVTMIDSFGAATSVGTTFTGGLVLDASGNLQVYSSASAFTTIDTGVSRYVVRSLDATAFDLHMSGALCVFASAGVKLQYPGIYASIALGPDGNLYVLTSVGSLYVAPAGSFNQWLVDRGVQAIVADATGDLYSLYTSGALIVMPVGSRTWTPVLTNVKAVTPTGGGVNVLTNAGVDWQFAGTTGTVMAGPHLGLTVAGTVTAGQTVTATLSVLDVFNNPVLGYTGTATFGDSDAPAVAAGDGPPLQHTFTSADNGSFSFPVTFFTSGTQTLTAADDSGLTASATLTVNPGAAVQFSVDSPSVEVGTAAAVTVTAYDAYGNVATGYTGPVTLTAVNGAPASPITYTYTTADQGMHAYSVTFTQAGAQKLVATGGSIVGDGAIVVTPAPYDLSKSTVSVTPTRVAVGGQVAVTLTVRDALGNQETSGGLTVAFALAAGSTTGGNFGATVDNGDGIYTALFTAGRPPGLDNFTAAIGGIAVTSSPAAMTVVKATPTITWANPADITYGTPLGATQLDAAASVPGTFTYTPPAGTVLKAGSGQTLSVTFTPTDRTDYTGATATVKITVKATPTITWANPADITYGTPLGATQLDAAASVPGTFTYTPPAGTVLKAGSGQTLSVTFTPTDRTDYTGATATVKITVKATPTITWANPADITYGTPLGATQLDAAASVPGTFTYTPPVSTVLKAGSGQTLSVTFTPTDRTDYTAASATVTIAIAKAIPKVTVSDAVGTDNGKPFLATVTVAGLNNTAAPSLEGVNPTLTYYAGTSANGSPLAGAPTAVGTYTVVAAFAGSADYGPAEASATFTIAKATPKVTVRDAGGTYNGKPFPATATVAGITGAAASSLEGVSLRLTYYAGATASGTPLAGAPVGAGTYTVVAAFPGSADYAAAKAAVTIAIAKAIPKVAVKDAGGTYNGHPFPATATVAALAGTAAPSLEGISPTVTYYAGTSATGSPLAGAPVGAGTYTVVATFPGSADYGPAKASATFVIARATPKVAVRDAGGTYNAKAFPATATVAGISGAVAPSLERVSPTLTYFAGAAASGRPLGGAPSTAGTYTVVAAFPGSADYAAAKASATFAIAKATPKVAVRDAGGTYNGKAFPATASVAGLTGTAASSLEGISPTLIYYTGTSATGSPLAGAPVGAGTYTVGAAFPGSADYAPAKASATFTIARATPKVAVKDAGGTYNAKKLFQKSRWRILQQILANCK